MNAHGGGDDLDHLRFLIETRQYWELERRLVALDFDDLVENREHGYSLAVAWLHLRRSADGLRLTGELLSRSCEQDDLLTSRIRLLHANFLSRESRLGEAEEAALTCVTSRAALEVSKYAASANNCLGIVYCLQGEWEQAVPQVLRTLTSYRQLGNAYGIAASSHNIGMAYRYMGHFEQAEHYFGAAATYYATDGIAEEMMFSEAERSLAILGLGDGRLATKMAQRSLEKCRRQINSELAGDILRILGMVYRDTGRRTEARSLFSEAYRAAVARSQTWLMAEINMEAARLDEQDGKRMASRRRLRMAKQYFRDSGATGFERMLNERETQD